MQVNKLGSKVPPADMIGRAGLVLEHPLHYPWTVQGFGMIRTYLDEEKQWRLNVWTPAVRVPNVSEIHDHPWSFRSWVLLGQLVNTRFLVHVPQPYDAIDFSRPYQHVKIITGEGGGPVGEPDTVRLAAQKPEIYGAGDSYLQSAEEVHITRTHPGTVTLNDRSPPSPDHTANIYWTSGPWVNAEPRPASREEVLEAVKLARIQAVNLRTLR